MIVSIGILAWNEEQHIGNTLESLLDQSLFSKHQQDTDVQEVEIVVVPNGCTDSTGEAAEKVLYNARSLFDEKFDAKIFTYHIITIDEAGKSNAWNRYVHEFSREDAEILFLMDADIEFGHSATLINMIEALARNPAASVSVDTPLKDIVKKERNSFLERISVRASEKKSAGPPAIAGSLYCGKAEVLRNIWMPIGLPVEDGFVRAMVMTDMFRAKADPEKVVRASNASHYYEACKGSRSIFKHELRLVIGTALNSYLCWSFLFFATDPEGPGAGVLIRNLTRHDPGWYSKFIKTQVQCRGCWVLPPGMLFRRFSKRLRKTGNTRDKRSINFLGDFLLALAGFVLDLPVLCVANYKIKRGRGLGYW